MRDVNFFSVLNNKAAATMTPTMYDRRALDCPYDRPLVNSLSSLCVLISSSQVIRESLATDGGIDRLVTILRSCTGMHSRDVLTSWKWSLTLQCLSSVGVRGTETVRRRVVDADVVPVLATILDNFLEAIEKLRIYHDVYAKYSDTATNNDGRRSLLSSNEDSETELAAGAGATRSPAVRPSARRVTAPATAAHTHTTDSPAMTDRPLFDNGIDANAAGAFMSLVAQVAEDERQQRQQQQQQQEEEQMQDTTADANATMTDTEQRSVDNTETDSEGGLIAVSNTNAYFNRIHYHMYRHHRHHHHRNHHSHSHTQPSPVLPTDANGSSSTAEAAVVEEEAMTGISTATTSSSDVEDSAAAMDIDEDVVVAPSSSLAQVPMSAEEVHASSEEATYGADVSSSSSLNAPRMLDIDYSAGYRNTTTSGPSQTLDSNSAEASAEGSFAARSPVAAARTSPAFESATVMREAEQAAMQAAAQTENLGPGNAPLLSSFPAFLGSQDNVPREEDVLLSLQLLAYVSKYVNLRECFQKTHLVPSLSMRPELRAKAEEQMANTESKRRGFDDPSLDPEDESLIEEEYKLPTLNLFQLVERFTARAYAEGDLSYWASIIMRNSCRKDESRGGVRQCGYFECGRWEEYPKQFAKCRRCRRTKYCSKSCQSKAWSFHRHWCVPPGQEVQMMNR
ncbi:hypothetical protein BZA70DRAFT_280596 [Myxozyma melibiosi]|uniref:MYND-type domain-containing protein n=1 Tax=Myxozyma melibiosi TaxID=54550 RepID=A0ABR1F3H9_9ASCO